MNSFIVKRELSEIKRSLFQVLINNAAAFVVAILLLFNILFTNNFASLNTLWLLISQSAGLIFPALGMTIVIASSGIDVSVGSMMALAGVAFTHMAYKINNVFLAIIFALIVCVLLGFFNGYMVHRWKVQPLILTLVMQMILRGVSLLSTNGNALGLKQFPEAEILGLYRFPGGLPWQAVPIIAFSLLVWFLLKKTVFGKNVEAIGANTTAARLSGVAIFGTIVAVYICSAVLSGIGGLIEMFRTGACDPTTMGLAYESSAIASVAIGGTSMKGGKAKVLGTILGAFLMTLITITVNMNNMPFAFSNIFKMIIIIFAVALQHERSV